MNEVLSDVDVLCTLSASHDVVAQLNASIVVLKDQAVTKVQDFGANLKSILHRRYQR
jgi:hypothetical protein